MNNRSPNCLTACGLPDHPAVTVKLPRTTLWCRATIHFVRCVSHGREEWLLLPIICRRRIVSISLRRATINHSVIA